MTICANCNAEGGEGKFCENCGRPMLQGPICPKCNHTVSATALFCPECASPLKVQNAPYAGFHTGDIGMVKGNVDASNKVSNRSYGGANVGSINIVMPQAQPIPQTSTQDSRKQPSNYIQSLDANVRSFLFYESPDGLTPKGQRTYRSRFGRKETHYVMWELNLSHPVQATHLDFMIQHIWYRADGEVLAQVDSATFMEQGWDWSSHQKGWGYSTVGDWQLGTYRVDLYINNIKIASGSFEILEQNPLY